VERLATCYPRHKQAEDEDTESLKRDNVDVRDKTATSAESAGEDLTAPNKPVSSPPSAIVSRKRPSSSSSRGTIAQKRGTQVLNQAATTKKEGRTQ